MSKISDIVVFAKLDLRNEYREINFGNLANFLAQEIAAKTGVTVKGAKMILTTNGIRHAIIRHANDKDERLRGQIGITDEDFELIPVILTTPDYITRGNDNNRKRQDTLVFFNKKSRCANTG